MWGSTFQVIVFADNRAVTRFFQTKVITPAFWNACDYVLMYNFVIAHVAGVLNKVADFLSRTEINPTEKLEMNVRNDIQTKVVSVNIQSSVIAEEEQIHLHHDDEIDKKHIGNKKTISEIRHRQNHTTNRKVK